MSKIYNIIENNYPEKIEKLIFNNVIRKNSDYSFVDGLKTIMLNDYFKEQDNLWSFFEESSEDFFSILYEHITNMLENTKDIDLCHFLQLQNIAKLLNIYNLEIFNLTYPEEIKQLIDTYSVNKEYVLYGKHSTVDLNEVFGDKFDGETELEYEERINQSYISELVDKSFEQLIINKFYDVTDSAFNEYLGFMELIIPDEYLGADYDYLVDISNGLPVRKSDNDHYDYLIGNDKMIYIAAKYLRNICIKVLFLRENLKSIAQKNSFIGTQQIIEKLITEYVIKNYSKIENFGFFVPNKTETQILTTGINNDPFKSWTNFLQNISTLGSVLDISVIEYYDTTEYLNIAPSAVPFKTMQVPIYEEYNEPYLGISGNLLYKDPIQVISGYNTVNTSIPARGTGNIRYWESQLTEDNTEDILKLFIRYGVINEGDNIDILMQFLNKLYDVHSPAYWNTQTPTNYKTQTDLDYMQAKYSNVSGELSYAASANIKATDYPTVAPLPFLWNLVEKTYEIFPQLIQLTLQSSKDLSTKYNNLVDIDGSNSNLYSPNLTQIKGIIINSWLNYANEAFGYISQHEIEDNKDNTNIENKNILIDGSFNMLALGDLLHTYNVASGYFQSSGTYDLAINYLATQISGYYENITF